jgi:ABC-type Fe3+/spermidine/putrescine transport system ATPase subunit
VAEFFGSINWLRGKMLDRNHVATDIGTLVINAAQQYEGKVMVGIRPEDVKLSYALNDPENRLEGMVISSTFLGDQVVMEVRVNDKMLVAKAQPDQEVPVERVSLRFPKERLVVFPEKLPRSQLW